MQLNSTFTGRTGVMLFLFFMVTGSLQAQKAGPVLTYNIINGAGNTFGYDVYANGRLQVHQPVIPALPGNKGFATKAAAEKVARLVIEKIKKGDMPPAVSIEEMKNLKSI